MIYTKINANTEISDEDFEEIEKALEMFRKHTHFDKSDVKKLNGYLERFKRLIDDENYSELEYIAECFMCNLRDIMANVKQETKQEVLIRCADSMGISVQKKDGILEVTLPMILPTKAKAKAEYLFEPLFLAMENFSKNESVFIKEKAMMCIEFIYDKNNKSIPRGDHDNKEVKQVIDAVSNFVVPDDSDDYLSLCQISTEGDYNHTKVYVMPEKDFGNFFLKHQNK